MKGLLLIAAVVFAPLAAEGQVSCCAPSATAEFASLGADPAFAAAHESPLPAMFATATGKMISFNTSDGKEGRAYEVKAEHPTQNVLFITHEYWGLNAYIKREAERWQRLLGDVDVYALDLYDGKTTTDPKAAGKLMAAAKESRIRAIIAGAIGPAVAAGQNALFGMLGVEIDLSPVLALFTGATAVAINQVGKQVHKTAAVVFLALAVALTAGCAGDPGLTAYKVMHTTGVAYNRAMQSAGDMYSQGQISDEQAAKVVELMRPFYLAYQEAVVALEIYESTKGVGDRDKLLKALKTLSEKSAEVQAYIDELKKKPI